MGRLDEPQSPVLDIGNSSAPQFEFEQIRMVCGSDQNGLLLEEDAFLPVRKDLFAHRRHLSILVGAPDEAGAASRLAAGRGLQRPRRTPRELRTATPFATSRICWLDR